MSETDAPTIPPSATSASTRASWLPSSPWATRPSPSRRRPSPAHRWPRRGRPGPDRHRKDRRLRPARADSHGSSPRRRHPRQPAQHSGAGPTRELAIQVAEAFTTYAAKVDGISVLPIYGGAPYGPQLQGLRRGANVVVGTPGRVIDHMEKGSLDLSEVEHLILDEADEMLRMASPKRWTRSSRRRLPTSRSRSSRRRCRPPSVASPSSTSTTRSR